MTGADMSHTTDDQKTGDQNTGNAKDGVQLALVAIGLGFLLLIVVFPLLGIFWQAFSAGLGPFWHGISDPAAVHALQLTLKVVAVVVPINTVMGGILAWVLVRHRFPGRRLLTSLVDLPVAISPVVAGLMFILLYSPRFGLLKDVIATLNLRIVFAYPGIVLTTLFVTMPFVVRELLPILENLNNDDEEAAKTLGASGWTTFWRVILPSIRWALMYGIVLCTARAIGEFGAAAVISGKLINQTNTFTLHIEQIYMEFDTISAYACACLMASVSLFSLLAQAILRRLDPQTSTQTLTHH